MDKFLVIRKIAFDWTLSILTLVLDFGRSFRLK